MEQSFETSNTQLPGSTETIDTAGTPEPTIPLSTEITGPVFWKEDNHDEKVVKEIDLLLAQSLPPEERKKLKERKGKKEAGIKGERKTAYQLKGSLLPMYIFHDLRLRLDPTSSVQIDFLLITQKGVFVIECKNFIGDLHITEDGRFIRKKLPEKHYDEESLTIDSPAAQNALHLRCAQSFCSQSNIEFHSLIVFAHPEMNISNECQSLENNATVIRLDQLTQFIQIIINDSNRNTISWDTMYDLANLYLAENQPPPESTYAARLANISPPLPTSPVETAIVTGTHSTEVAPQNNLPPPFP